MGKASTAATILSQGEQRALASFIAGRLPAGQLHEELSRARATALAKAAAQPMAHTAAPAAAPAPSAVPAPALHAA
ncbi:MAG: hypothetical protein QOD71_703 [Thermoleophilaceae bacterium]|nr:hypothetical protein [Thermoleophilaceae bacterium]